MNGKISYQPPLAIEIAASSQKSFAGGSRSEQQTVARVNPGPKVAAMLLKILSGITFVVMQKFLEVRYCLRKCFEKDMQLLLGRYHLWQLSDTN